jgi:hypothetical protein
VLSKLNFAELLRMLMGPIQEDSLQRILCDPAHQLLNGRALEHIS